MNRTLLTLTSIALPIISLNNEPANAAPRLQSGHYFAQGSMFASSSITIANQRDRSCIQIKSGPPRPYAGYTTIIISSISYNNSNAIVDDDQSPLTINSPTEFERMRGLWQRTNRTSPTSNDLQACLNARGLYSKKTQGEFIPGAILDRTQATLIDKTPTERINVRQSPGTQAKILHYGLVGDRVTLISADLDRAGALWYFVKFDRSGATGWIHNKLIQRLN
jgi:hypothetical protein